MICPSCKSKTHQTNSVSVEDKINGKVRTFVYCNYCPVEKEPEEKNFPAIIVKGGKRGRKPKGYDEVLNRVAPNSPEEIMRNRQLVASAPRMIDTPNTRNRDDINKRRAEVSFMTDLRDPNRKGGAIGKYVTQKLSAQLGTEKWKIVKNDGVTITAEAE